VPISEKQIEEHIDDFVMRLVVRAPRTMLNVKRLDEVRALVGAGG
jgi:hypothetical protein